MLIGLCGYKRSGKSTVANVLIDELGFTPINFADALRHLAYNINPVVGYYAKQALLIGGKPSLAPVYYAELIDTIGYEKAKEVDEVRRYLQRLGTEGIRNTFGEDIWVEIVRQQLDQPESASLNVVIADVRFPNEAQLIRDLDGTLIRINRPGYVGDNHPSELHIATLPAQRDITAENIDDLRRIARETINELKGVAV